jgi:hypothetical protein
MADLFTRFARGWDLTKASLNVLRLDTEILLLPVLSGVVMLLLAGGVFGTLVLRALGGTPPSEGTFIAAFLLVYFVGYFVVIFFNTAVVGMASMRFDGKDPVLRDGLRTSTENLGRIAQWALLAATVGLLLRILRGEMRERYGFVADLLVGGLEYAWDAIVYFVIPVMVYRKVGPGQAIRESAQLMRRTWGETLAGEVGMGLVFFLLGAAGLLVVLATAFLSASLVVTAAVFVAVLVYWLVLAVVYSAAQGVLTAALYRYATTGQVPHGFAAGSVANALA